MAGFHKREKYQRIQINLSAGWSNTSQNKLSSFANSQMFPVSAETYTHTRILATSSYQCLTFLFLLVEIQERMGRVCMA